MSSALQGDLLSVQGSSLVFTQLMSEIVMWARLRCIWIYMYLDDWLIVHKDQIILLEQLNLLLQQVTRLGIFVNQEKSKIVPSQSFVFLGMHLDTKRGTVTPTENWWRKVLPVKHQFLDQNAVTATEFRSLLGRLSWAATYVPLGRGVPIGRQKEEQTVMTDASLLGCEGHIEGNDAWGGWNHLKGGTIPHINCLELLAIKYSLQNFQRDLQGKVVAVLSDNTTALAYLKNQGGTRSLPLLEISTVLLQWCLLNLITLVPRFIPGVRNIRADWLSRRNRPLTTEWCLNRSILGYLFSKWGEPVVDLFTTKENKVVPVFVSPYPDQQFWGPMR